ncbi:MAG: FAD-binding protein [Planctomycetes bacterium]|nr:FAD-binding protein [Planctomycetota bacterium]
MNSKNHNTFEQKLRSRIRGDVFFDDVTLGIYATDASIYQITPLAVVLPRDREDVLNAIRIAAQYHVPIVPRGAGTSLGGQAVAPALVLDFSRYLNQILEINTQQRWVRVQPGVVLDKLNATLAQHGLFFAPDPATGNRAVIGGMIGNNSSGMRSIVYGIMRDHVLETQVALTNGSVMNCRELTPQQYQEHTESNQSENHPNIYAGFKKIIESNRNEIEKKFPKVMRRVQGYNLDAFTSTDRWNLAHLMVGSEGTLGVFLEAKLHLVPLPRHKVLCTVHFNELPEAIGAVSKILPHKPSAVEIVDSDVITRARENLNIAPLCSFIQGNPQAILVVEFFGDSPEHAQQKAQKLAADLKKKKLGYAYPIFTEPTDQLKVWNVRKNGLGLLLGVKTARKPIAFIEDVSVPVEVLPEYIDKVLTFCRKRDVPVAMYAHASVGTIHVRPILNLKDQADIDHMKAIAAFVFNLVPQYGGSMSGEHGDGRNRSPFLLNYFGETIYTALKDVKRLFDPDGLLNPGVIIDPAPMDQNLRYGPNYPKYTGPTEYHYREDGSFATAVEMCNGVGACRQDLIGTMCPSYRATLDEKHSTRGRANALRLAMTGQLGPNALTSKGLYEVFDLCLSCKACKSECPSNVDLARLKSEFLQKYHDAHPVSLREKIVAYSTVMSSLIAGWPAFIVNAIQKSLPFRLILEEFTGFDHRRQLPEYAMTPFSKWFEKHHKPNGNNDLKVVLFDDTYLNYHETSVGISAVELLESCGYQVILARAGCCQRPRISHGFLRQAKIHGEVTLCNLDTYIQQGLKIVVCEPGCASALTDDLPDLIDDEALGQRIKQNVVMIDQFLAHEIEQGNIKCEFTSTYKNILIHGHCHQKSLYGTTFMKTILDKIPNLNVSEVDSGCCGMAGSFGYEKEHYDMSLKIGEERLFPAIRKRSEGAAVVACGFSCRHQIKHGTDVDAVHWVETLRGKPL